MSLVKELGLLSCYSLLVEVIPPLYFVSYCVNGVIISLLLNSFDLLTCKVYHIVPGILIG